MANSTNRKRTLIPGKLYRLSKSLFYATPDRQVQTGIRYHYMTSDTIVLYLGLSKFNNTEYHTILKQDGTVVYLTAESFEGLRLVARNPTTELQTSASNKEQLT